LVPALIADLGDEAAWRYVEFLTASIRNPHTRCAYARACNRFFAWCEELMPAAIRPHDVATYIEQLQDAVLAPLGGRGCSPHTDKKSPSLCTFHSRLVSGRSGDRSELRDLSRTGQALTRAGDDGAVMLRLSGNCDHRISADSVSE
jgi:hypothetical protein